MLVLETSSRILEKMVTEELRPPMILWTNKCEVNLLYIQKNKTITQPERWL